MLSYKHIFHAGNHADVIKHLSWLAVIEYLKNKAKPFTLFDTHAGAGLYSLDSEQAQKNSEFKSGISAVIESTFSSPLLNDYKSVCTNFWSNTQYPGSPIIAANLLREQDKLHAMELHPNEVATLKQTMRFFTSKKQVHVHHRDGLEGVQALVPPESKRGAILIDPPYELKREYQDVAKSIKAILSKWHNGQIILWYPLLSERAKEKSGLSEQLVAQLSELKAEMFTAELLVANKSDDDGMYGSGVCVLNPSWNLAENLSQALEEFCQIASPAVSRIQWYNKS